jgi:hypothetical protein
MAETLELTQVIKTLRKNLTKTMQAGVGETLHFEMFQSKVSGFA